MERGEFDNYQGKGEPFSEEFFEDNPYVPEEMKHTMKLLGGSGFLPPEVLLKREIEVLRVKVKSKKLTPPEREKLLLELNTREIELEARLEFYRS